MNPLFRFTDITSCKGIDTQRKHIKKKKLEASEDRIGIFSRRYATEGYWAKTVICVANDPWSVAVL